MVSSVVFYVRVQLKIQISRKSQNAAIKVLRLYLAQSACAKKPRTQFTVQGSVFPGRKNSLNSRVGKRGNHAGKAPIVPAGAYDTRRGGQTNLYTVAPPFKSGPRSCMNSPSWKRFAGAGKHTHTHIRVRTRERERESCTSVRRSYEAAVVIDLNDRFTDSENAKENTQRDDNPFRTHCGIFRPTKRRSIRSCIEHS